MPIWLKQSTSVVVSMGPFLDPTDGKTLVTGLVSAIDHASTGIFLSKNGGTLTIRHASVTASTYDAYGNYKVTLDTTDTNTLGTLRMQFAAAASCLPVWMDMMVVPANVWDSMFGSDLLQVDVEQFGNANLTSASGVPEVKVASIAANAITATAINADAITAAKIADNAIDAATFAASALDAVWSTAARTLTAGTNIQLPSNGLANVVAWTVAITGNITGNLSGSVGSVSGAVGSVTGNVGGNVVGSVASVAGAVGSVTGNVGGNVVGSVASIAAGGIVAASFAADSITSSALAASAVSEIQSGITPLDAAGTRSALGMASANLDTQLAAIAALIPSANTNADALLDRGDAIESSYTVRQALRLVLSVLAGPSSGLDGTTATYRDVNDSKNRVIATIDADGNRSGMTYDVT